MMFIVRSDGQPPLEVKATRRSPGGGGGTDYFCLGDPAEAAAAGLPVVRLHDGWYADDTGGGVAIWGQGMFWEVRDTPFSVKQACGPEAWPATVEHDREAVVNVRQAIFRG
jgi:hypothetical protein